MTRTHRRRYRDKLQTMALRYAWAFEQFLRERRALAVALEELERLGATDSKAKVVEIAHPKVDDDTTTLYS